MSEVGEEWDYIVLLLRTLDKEGPINQAKLAERMGSNKNRVGRYVNALTARGLVEKKLDPGPPRQTIIVLTKKGRCILRCLEEEV